MIPNVRGQDVGGAEKSVFKPVETFALLENVYVRLTRMIINDKWVWPVTTGQSTRWHHNYLEIIKIIITIISNDIIPLSVF